MAEASVQQPQGQAQQVVIDYSNRACENRDAAYYGEEN
jgi:hypothetical protein